MIKGYLVGKFVFREPGGIFCIIGCLQNAANDFRYVNDGNSVQAGISSRIRIRVELANEL